MAASTRPLTLGEILDRTVQLYRRNFALFVGISVVPSALYVLLSGSASLYITTHNTALQNPKAGGAAFLMLGLFGLLFVLIGLPILLGLSAVTVSALNDAAMMINHGAQTTVRASFAFSFRNFWRSLGILCLQIVFAGIIPGAAAAGIVVIGSILVALIAGTGGGTPVAVVLGLLMFVLVAAVVVVCVLIWLRLSLAFPVSAAEQQAPWPSIKRSNLLSKGTRGRIFVMYLLVTVLSVVVYYMLTLPVDIILKLTLYKSMAAIALFTKPPVALQIVNLVVSCLERTFVLPIYAIALVLFYTDQRTRLEGYDIEQLMANAGWSDFPPLAAAPQTTVAAFPVADFGGPYALNPVQMNPVQMNPVQMDGIDHSSGDSNHSHPPAVAPPSPLPEAHSDDVSSGPTEGNES